MNNVVIAILEAKKVLSPKEAEALAEFTNNNVLPSRYKDAVASVAAILDKVAAKK